MELYNLLGVPPDASGDQIRAAFRRQAKHCHPDAHPDVTGDERVALQRRFVRLAQAYHTLSDPGRRAAYDRRHRARAASAGSRQGSGTTGAPGAGAHAEGEGPEYGWADLRQDVAEVLGRFGVDLRPQWESALEKLVRWAEAVFRDVVAAARVPPPPDDEAEGAAGAAAGEEGRRGKARTASPDREAARATRERARAEAAVEEELADLKRRRGTDA